MKRYLAILVTLSVFAAAAARAAEPVAYYDLGKALTDGSDAKKEAEAAKGEQGRQQAEIDGIDAEGKKLEADCAKSPKATSPAKPCADATVKRQRAGELYSQYTRQNQQRSQASQVATLARVGRILPAIAKAKHLAALVPLGGAFYVASGVDLTAEVLRRLDAGEGKDDDQVPPGHRVHGQHDQLRYHYLCDHQERGGDGCRRHGRVGSVRNLRLRDDEQQRDGGRGRLRGGLLGERHARDRVLDGVRRDVPLLIEVERRA